VIVWDVVLFIAWLGVYVMALTVGARWLNRAGLALQERERFRIFPKGRWDD
jgi:hypothetical protein